MRPQYGIRRAGARDLPAIGKIERASFGREAYDCKLFAHYRNKCGDLFLVAERGGKVCGYLLSCMRGPAAELVSVAVAPEFRGKGAASALLESLLRRLVRRGATRLRLVVRGDNAAARAFYEKYGFRRLRVVPGYYEDGGDGIAMTRPVRRMS
ncbi:MAG TPA: ribosomal protein S18-alanine N-acetyltransferase [Bryobacteraceae bacterium]|nr:ribosomal protein S18-alanine N-acetyltransferase [Bryobacteraceae bacterium]